MLCMQQCVAYDHAARVAGLLDDCLLTPSCRKWWILRLSAPFVDAVHKMRPGGHHAAQGVLAPDYELHADPKLKVRYALPTGTDIDVYRKAIEDLPAQEGPNIFGLNPNADLTFRSLQVYSEIAPTDKYEGSQECLIRVWAWVHLLSS